MAGSEMLPLHPIPSFSPQNYQSSSEACAPCRQLGSWPALVIPGEGIFLQSLHLLPFPPVLLWWPTLFLDEAGALQRLLARGPSTAPSCGPPASEEPLIRSRMAGFVSPLCPGRNRSLPAALHPSRWVGGPGLRGEETHGAVIRGGRGRGSAGEGGGGRNGTIDGKRGENRSDGCQGALVAFPVAPRPAARLPRRPEGRKARSGGPEPGRAGPCQARGRGASRGAAVPGAAAPRGGRGRRRRGGDGGPPGLILPLAGASAAMATGAPRGCARRCPPVPPPAPAAAADAAGRRHGPALRPSARRGDGEGRGAGSRQRELRRAEQPGGGPGRSARQPPPQPRPLPASAESGPWGAGRSRRAAPPTSGIRAAGLEAAGYHP